MKKLLILSLISLICITAAWGRDYHLRESEDIRLSGIDTIVIDINTLRCIACMQRIDIETVLEGTGRGDALSVSLEGKIRSNRRKAVPGIIVDRHGRELRLSVYKENTTVIGLVSGGTAEFTVRVPANFEGSLQVRSSSEDITLKDLAAGNILAHASSGNIEAEGLEAGNITIEASSGNIDLDRITASGDLFLKASSGNIGFGDIAAGGKGTLKLSSGNLDGKSVQSGELEIRSSSGTIEIEAIRALDKVYIEASSGDVVIGLPGIEDDIEVSCSSGNIELLIPRNSRYTVNLSTSSGKIRVDDPVTDTVNNREKGVTGEVNGGGPMIMAHTSSGNISIGN